MAFDDITLFHSPRSRSSIAGWMLEEIGIPYRIHTVDLSKGEQLAPEYLAVNPMGKVPALRHGATTVTEAAAICCYLADAFPSAGLAPAIGDPLRGPYLTWLFWSPSCFEPAVIDNYLKRAPGPRGMMGWIDYKSTLDILARRLATGPWLLGERFTAADVVVGAGVSWGLQFGTVESRPEFVAYAERVRARPAFQRAMAGT